MPIREPRSQVKPPDPGGAPELGWPSRVVLKQGKGPIVTPSLSWGEDRTLGKVPLCTKGQFPKSGFLD